MTYKETIEQLLTVIDSHPDIKSCGYGDPTAYDVSKQGVQYPRAYLSLIDASKYAYNLELVVTGDVYSDRTNQLEVESDTLQYIKELVLIFQSMDRVKIDEDPRYVPTHLYQRDQSAGWKVEFEVRVDEIIECKVESPKKPKYNQ